MKELPLKYGLNPNQAPARVFRRDDALPVEVLSGQPGTINLMDALGGWQLARELRGALGCAAAASMKHVSPAGAAIGRALTQTQARAFAAEGIDGLLDSEIGCAYARARGTDRMSSYGDFIALSDPCDVPTAKFIARQVSDGIVAPGYAPEALEILKAKRKGRYVILRMDPDYVPEPMETRTLFGLTFEQRRNDSGIDETLLSRVVTARKALPQAARRDLVLGMIVLKYTQSNSVCVTYDGQTAGVGAGQQSRIHCTRLACDKADTFRLRSTDRVLNLPFLEGLPRAVRDNAIDAYLNPCETDICADDRWPSLFSKRPEPLSDEERRALLSRADEGCLASDAFFPFDDNVRRAYKSGVRYIAQPGGSVRDEDVIACCDRLNIAMAFTGLRLFYH